VRTQAKEFIEEKKGTKVEALAFEFSQGWEESV
jgi:hypothetical protein